MQKRREKKKNTPQATTPCDLSFNKEQNWVKKMGKYFRADCECPLTGQLGVFAHITALIQKKKEKKKSMNGEVDGLCLKEADDLSVCVCVCV